MKLRKGPRPAAIRWFAVLFAAAALLSLIDGLPASAARMSQSARDMAIIGSSARFTIALMTTSMVWFAAIGLARWLIVGALAIKIAGTAAMIATTRSISFISPMWLVATALGVVAATLLFTPSANRWFARPQATVANVFD